MRFRFVEEHSGAFPVERLCQVMNVSPRGLWDFRSRPASCRQRTDMVSPRLFMNNGATATAISCDCSGSLWRRTIEMRGVHRLSSQVGRGRQAQANLMNEEGEARIAAQRARAMAVIRVRVNRAAPFHLKSADPVLRADIERWMSVAGIRDEPDLEPRLTKAGATSGTSVFPDRQPGEAWLVPTTPAAGRATALSRRRGTAPPHRPVYLRLSAPRCAALPPASVRGLRHRLRR